MLGNIGLFLDILGFALMLVFNPRMNMLEEHIDTALKTGKSVLTIPDYSSEQLSSIKRSMNLHKHGIGLVIAGFILQFVNSMWPSLNTLVCSFVLT